MSRRFAFHSPGAPSGQFTFSGNYSGFGLADFLFGRPINSRLDVTKFFSLQRFYYSWFVQDNWRVNSRLSVNMGLRNDSITAWKERHNRLAGVRARGRRQSGSGRDRAVHRRFRAGGAPMATGAAPGPRLHDHAEDGPARRRRDFLQLQDRHFRQLAGEERSVQRDPADHERRQQLRRRQADLGRIPRRTAGTVADRRKRVLLLAAGREDLHDVRMEHQPAARTGVEHGAVCGVRRRQRNVRRCGGIEYQPGGPRARRGGDTPPLSEPQRCHRRGAVGQLDLQFPADDVRAAHGRGPFFRRLDVGAQHRQHQRRIEQQPDSELARSGCRSAAAPPSTCVTNSRSAAPSNCRSARAGTGSREPRGPVQWLAGGWQVNTIGDVPDAGCRSRPRCRRTT